MIGWIPDFQHVHHPEFFKPDQCRRRDANFRRIAERSAVTILSSFDARQDFLKLFPDLAHKARVWSFPSLFAFKEPLGDPLVSLRKFNLPRKYLLIANQFWRHKNHQVVIEAIRLLTCGGMQVHAVMTGLPLDYRDANNETTSQILQSIASAGVGPNITVLGMVDDADFENLIRAAAVVVQPSRSEGWSTIIQDAKALGRPIVCSDIPVHREQIPDALGFFDCDRPDELAELFAEAWPRLTAGPDDQEEGVALEVERNFAAHHGQTLLEICREAASGMLSKSA